MLYTHFIKRLIVHIPDKHFKMVRYHGIYTKHHKQEIISKKLPICEVFYKVKTTGLAGGLFCPYKGLLP
ncbi:transposase, partial [Enterocloster citroniae]|uniref:transposase n=1 Tax=Enterocloster citroniae TaxID=358743 RepID=UPI001A9A3DC9